MQLPKDDHVKYDSRYDGFHLKYLNAEGFIIFPKPQVNFFASVFIVTLLMSCNHRNYFRARKLDWEQIKFKEFSAEDCKKYWEYIQVN